MWSYRLQGIVKGAALLRGLAALMGSSADQWFLRPVDARHNRVHVDRQRSLLEAGGYQQLADKVQSDLGISNPAAEHGIDGTAPYWRAALQKSTGPH
jgi:hypothetical protein